VCAARQRCGPLPNYFDYLFSPLCRCVSAARRAIYSSLVSYLFIYLFLMISVKRIISQSTALIFAKFWGVGRIMAVDDQSEISFSISQGTLSRQPFFRF